ncbi:MAG: hypothetical protein V7774_09665 [Pseudorhizobium pelagicum]|uniref:hypothetical protein n=1 Tax=Pseudorhizobium pelagicum TaxID=1509405 RepID=UPI002A981F31|nr:hypothetical protein [Pseudomonadota bacterium]
MAVNTPNPSSLARKIALVWMAIVDPAQFEAEEDLDNALLNKRNPEPEISRLHVVRRAFAEALLWCFSALVLGTAVGVGALVVLGPNSRLTLAIVVLGTVILLYATLALQGWNIQSFGGVTLTEQLNRWVFRCLYCLGTFLIVVGSAWSVAS